MSHPFSDSAPRRERPGPRLDRRTSLGYLVNLLARQFGQALTGRIAPWGVVPGQLAVLICLWEEDGLSQAELRRRIRVEQPTMARTLQRMARDGLVNKRDDPRDRRKTRIRLTSRARSLEPVLARAAGEVNHLAWSGLNRSERKLLLDLLLRISQNLARGRAPEERDISEGEDSPKNKQ